MSNEPTVVRMTVAEWIAVQDNPIQRDTERRAQAALKRHLKELSPTHSIVHAAILPNRQRYKLDGHTRAYLWGKGLLQHPTALTVVVYPARTMDEVECLYKQFDSPMAVENATDRLSGAFRKYGMSPVSICIAKGGLTSALRIICGQSGRTGFDVYAATALWLVEINLLDAEMFGNERMSSPLIAAALLTIRKHGVRALLFWRTFHAKGGDKIDGRSDGADALERHLEVRRAKRALSGFDNQLDVCSKAISCCEAWLQGRSLVGIKGVDIEKYIGGIGIAARIARK